MSSSDSFPQVGFIGLGAMGFAMSTHLVRTGVPVTGYDIYEPTLDRWQSTCNEIPNSRASIARSPAEAVKSAELVCLMVANHHHVHSALFEEKVGAVHALPKNCIVIINATIPPTQPSEVWSRLTNEFHRSDIKLIDAPVSGGTARSINGTLTIMASADDPKILEEHIVQTILSNLANKGQTLYPIPGGLGSGESAKALNQVMCGIHIVAASEIMGLAAINGLNTQLFYDTLISQDQSTGKKHRGWTWMFENRGPRMLSATPPMSSATAIIDKDVNIIRDEEKRLNVTLPLLNRASEVLQSVMKTHSKEDDSCVVQYYLGFDSERQGLVVKQVDNNSSRSSEQVQNLATAHALIQLTSAYETVRFAQALNLMGPEQKKQWFAIIAGAAGGSTTFSEVIPQVFAAEDDIEVAFKKYANDIFGKGAVEDAAKLVEHAKSQKYEPVLLEGAVSWVRELLSSS